MDSLIGKTLGSYQILERIGRGGMGGVYKAYQPASEGSTLVFRGPAWRRGEAERAVPLLGAQK